MEQDHNTEEKTRNYNNLKEILETGLAMAKAEEDLRRAKNCLIEVQAHFKGLLLRREDREELYGRLQSEFTRINALIDEEKLNYEMESDENYSRLKLDLTAASEMADKPSDFRKTWDTLIGLQDRMKASRLKREHREELFLQMQDIFSRVKSRREQEKLSGENEANQNYIRLRSLVEKGLEQARETNEYKETREFLKKIQAEFRGIRMQPEKREELYSRLQTAFEVLRERLDDYFRNKKKNWEVKMRYRLSEFSAELFKLREELKKEEEYLDELEDQLEIITSSGRENSPVKLSLQARINTAGRNIERIKTRIAAIGIEQAALESRLEQPEPSGKDEI